MATFQGRSGPAVKTLTRRVDNLVYDSVDEIIIEYKNYEDDFHSSFSLATI